MKKDKDGSCWLGIDADFGEPGGNRWSEMQKKRKKDNAGARPVPEHRRQGMRKSPGNEKAPESG